MTGFERKREGQAGLFPNKTSHSFGQPHKTRRGLQTLNFKFKLTFVS